MTTLYYYDEDLDYIIGYGKGFLSVECTSEDENYFYYSDHCSENRICKKALIEQHCNQFTKGWSNDRSNKKFFINKSDWLDAKQKLFKELLRKNEVEKNKIIAGFEHDKKI